MEIKLTKREMDLILNSLAGTRYSDRKLELEKSELFSRLVDERNKYEY